MEPSLLHRYRLDRRKLLEFVISSSGGAVDVSDADLDTVSVDHVLNRLQSGGVLDVAEARERFFDEIQLPNTIHKPSGNLYFLISKPESSGPPPQRAAPLTAMMFDYTPYSKRPANLFVGRKVKGETGLSDDDLRETAYEVLIASVKTSGGYVHLFQGRKQEKKNRFLTSLRSKKDGQSSRQPEDFYPDLMDVVRVQMEVQKERQGWLTSDLWVTAQGRELAQGDQDQNQQAWGYLKGHEDSVSRNQWMEAKHSDSSRQAWMQDKPFGVSKRCEALPDDD